MEEKLCGIVLSGVNFGENDKILSIFTPDKGVVSAKIKGVKKAGAKMKFAAEPFCFVEYVFSVRNNLRTVIGASLLDSFYPIREDVKKFFAAGAAAEFDKKFLKEGINSADVFVLTTELFKNLAYGNDPPESLLLSFLVSALRYSGYALNLEGCLKCGEEPCGKVYFDHSSGGFLCEECRTGEGREINLSTYLALKRVAAGETIAGEEAVKPLKLLDYYISLKPEENLKALKELIKICR